MLPDKSLTPLIGETKEGRVGFVLGYDNVNPETAMPAGALREAENVDLDKSGRVRRRPGLTLRYTGSGIHSLWAGAGRTLFAEGGALKQLGSGWTATTLATGLSSSAMVSYQDVAGQVWWTNGSQSGRITADGAAGSWAVPNPNGQPTLSVRTGLGGLAAGRYQVAVTFLSADWEESGTGLAAVVDVAQGDGITLSNIPQGDAALVRIYMTPPNGDAFYHYRDLAMGVTSTHIGKATLGRRLETQFAEPLPPGQIVRFYNSRMWVASGSVLWHSLAFRYGLHQPEKDFFYFPSRITVLEPVDDGIYVVADKTYFLAGGTPGQMQLSGISDATGVEGTGLRVQAKHFALEDTKDEVAFWFGSRGAQLGLPGGALKAVMEDRAVVPLYEEGAALFRERNGIRQVVTTVKRPGDTSAFAAVDSAVAEVVRNGVLLP